MERIINRRDITKKGDIDSECKLSNGRSQSYKVIKLLLLLFARK